MTYLDLLRTRVIQRSASTPDSLSICREMTESKVDQRRAANWIDEDVGPLEIFMRDVECMEGVDSHAQSSEEGDKFIEGPGFPNLSCRMRVKG
jgi:hypothetical protein